MALVLIFRSTESLRPRPSLPSPLPRLKRSPRTLVRPDLYDEPKLANAMAGRGLGAYVLISLRAGVDGLVLKAQVLAGGRGKGHFDNGFQGGVQMVDR